MGLGRLEALRRRVARGEGSCHATDCEVFAAMGALPDGTSPTGSADAAMALRDSRLSGWRITLAEGRGPGGRMTFARIESPDYQAEHWEAGGRSSTLKVRGHEGSGSAIGAGRAICVAMLAAMESMEQAREDLE